MNRTETYFDWRAFLDVHDISYTPHEGRGWAEIQCPFCGEYDRGRHMGVRLDPASPGWSCWKDYEHRGHHPEKLIQALLGCSHLQAVAIVEHSRQAAADHALLADRTEEGPSILPAPQEALRLPVNFQPLTNGGGYSWEFLDYLEERGFDTPAAVAAAYDLRYCLGGPFAWRLIIPVFDAENRLLTWTGRSVRPGYTPKYRSLSHRPMPGQVLALKNIKDIIYYPPHPLPILAPSLPGGPPKVLVVTEGPFDALKVDWYGRPHGIRATCLFGKGWTERQLCDLALEGSMYSDGLLLCLDSDAVSDAARLRQELTGLCRNRAVLLPRTVKDPGDLTREQVIELFQ